MNAAQVHATWRALPVADLDAITGTGPCVVLAPHPDDESLGCGGLIAACCAAGRPPLVAVLTDGTGSHPGSLAYPAERLRDVRMSEVLEAVGHLGLAADRVVFLNQRDTAAPVQGPAFDAVVRRLAGLCEGATALLAPWRFDPHCDHEAAALIAAAVAALAGIRHVAYPVWGWTLDADDVVGDCRTGWRLDIAAWLPAKRAAIQAHRSQYGGLITDDPTGFQLPPGLLAVFDAPFETFLEV
jgi:LmbE family N-acetylglucosaminyl deacetylase